MKTLLNHLIIALLPALAAAFFVLVIWLWTTAPTLLDTAGVQEMGFAAEESGAQAPAETGGLAEPEGSTDLAEPPAEPTQEAQATPAEPAAQTPAETAAPPAAAPAPAAPGRNPAPLVFWITFGIVAAGR